LPDARGEPIASSPLRAAPSLDSEKRIVPASDPMTKEVFAFVAVALKR
jgi:hypothetical protein